MTDQPTNTDDLNALLQYGSEDESFVIRYHQIDASDCNQHPRQTILFHINHSEGVFDVYWATWSPEHEEQRFERKKGRELVINRMLEAENTPFHLHNIPYQPELSLRGNLMFAVHEIRDDLFDYQDGVIDFDEIPYVSAVYDKTETELNRFVVFFTGIAFSNALLYEDEANGNRFENHFIGNDISEPYVSNNFDNIYDMGNPFDYMVERIKNLWLKYIAIPTQKMFV